MQGFGTDDNQVMKDNIIWKVHECTLEVNVSFIVFLKHGARVAISEKCRFCIKNESTPNEK